MEVNPLLWGLSGLLMTYKMTYLKRECTDLGSEFYFLTNALANLVGAALALVIIGLPTVNLLSTSVFIFFILFYVKVSNDRISSYIKVLKSDPVSLLMGLSVITIIVGYVWDLKIPDTSNIVLLVLAIFTTLVFIKISPCSRGHLVKSYYYAILIKVLLMVLTFYKLGAIGLFFASTIILVREKSSFKIIRDQRVIKYILIAGVQTAILAVAPIVLRGNSILFFIMLSFEPLVTYLGFGLKDGFQQDKRYVTMAIILLCVFTFSIQ